MIITLLLTAGFYGLVGGASLGVAMAPGVLTVERAGCAVVSAAMFGMAIYLICVIARIGREE